ncbi:hypothetical protein ACQRIU_002341 [Beauveria bassiana]
MRLLSPTFTVHDTPLLLETPRWYSSRILVIRQPYVNIGGAADEICSLSTLASSHLAGQPSATSGQRPVPWRVKHRPRMRSMLALIA